jgi:predicted lysophospholipase L1 biosynthesis ABC-type transport system permease subunit
MGANTVVIPAKSVRESDADNIIAYGPMKDTTTAFQIPNGSIEKFMEKWLAQGNEELEITFHDKGYTQLQRGLENMKRIAALFLAIGAAMSLALVFFFCHVFISKNRMRTAIERMMGYTKKQCAASLLCGFLLAAALSVALGCAVGAVAQGQITDGLVSREYYDTSFTTGVLGSEGVALVETDVSSLFSPIAGLALLTVMGVVSAAFMRGNVKQEPLALLGERKD